MIILNSFKKVKFFLLMLVIFIVAINQPVFGDDELETKLLKPVISDKIARDKKAPQINALAAVIMETSSGRVLYEKNASVKRSIASTTKIMTAIVALENGNPDDVVTISKRAAAIGGSAIGFQTGQEYTLKELLYALLLNSANDAAVAIAEHIGGSVEGFADMMNQKGQSIGAADTRFVTPHGLDAQDQYSTAYDMAIITRYAMKNPVFAEIVSTIDSRIPGFSLYNTNELLGVYPGVDGVKTGYTGKAGRCLITSVQQEGMRIISVVLGSPTRSARANATKALLDYSYENYSMRKLIKAGDICADVPVYRGKKGMISLEAVQDVELPLTDEEADILEINRYVPACLNAPVYGGTETGYIEYKLNGEIVAATSLRISASIRRLNYFDYLAGILKSWGRIMREGIFAG